MIFAFPANHVFSEHFGELLTITRSFFSKENANDGTFKIEESPLWQTLDDLEQLFFNFLSAKWAIANCPEAKNLKIASLHPRMFHHTFESREALSSFIRSSKLMKDAYGKLPGEKHRELAEDCQIFIDKFENGVIYE